MPSREDSVLAAAFEAYPKTVIGRKEKVERAWTELLPDNQTMLHLAKKLGIEVTPRKDAGRLVAVKQL